MEFLKRNWSTLLLIGTFAAYLGLSMGTDRCPLCVVTDFATGATSDSTTPRNNAQVVGELEPVTWQAKTIDGLKINSDSCKGKVTLVVYWATWCAPCREEIPTLIALRNDFSKDEIEIIGVSVDEAYMSIEHFVTTNKINYDIAKNNESLDQAFGPIRYIPTIVILDQGGKVHQRHTGVVGPNILRGQVQLLLEKKL
jgi:thiol-disulfide isomerase/thioredoxin